MMPVVTANVKLERVGGDDVCDFVPAEMAHLGQEDLPARGREVQDGGVEERGLRGVGDGGLEGPVEEEGGGVERRGAPRRRGAVARTPRPLPGMGAMVMGGGGEGGRGRGLVVRLRMAILADVVTATRPAPEAKPGLE